MTRQKTGTVPSHMHAMNDEGKKQNKNTEHIYSLRQKYYLSLEATAHTILYSNK
jgi:hypothetical protein